MRTAVIFLIGLCFVFGRSHFRHCKFSSSDESLYSLASLSTFNITDSSSSIWSVHACGRRNVTVPAIIMTDINGTTTIRGEKKQALWSDSPLGASAGAEVVFGTDDVCPSGGFFKTAIEFVCGPSVVPTYSFQFDECFTVIYVNSSNACPITTLDDSESNDVDIDNGDEDDDDNELYSHDHDGHHGLKGIFLFPFISALIFSICCFCCCARRHRSHRQRQIMKNFSNTAFEPIPTSNIPRAQQPSLSPPQVALPTYNPYITQPSYFYYYPSQEMGPRYSIQADESMARELQSKFDQEARRF